MSHKIPEIEQRTTGKRNAFIETTLHLTLLNLEISLPKFGDVASFLVGGVSVSLATLLKLLDIVVSVVRRHFAADGDFFGLLLRDLHEGHHEATRFGRTYETSPC